VTTPDFTELVVSGVLDAKSVERPSAWSLRPATIVTASAVTPLGNFDGDGVLGQAATPVPLTSLIGYVAVGERVMVLVVPPSGNYVIASLSEQPGWTTYSPVFTSTGVAPDVGDGSVTGRWLKVGYRTIAVEVLTLWGAGSNQGTGRYLWSTPFAASSDGVTATGACYMLDNGTANRAGIVNVSSGLDQYFVTNTPNGDVGANVPHAWTATDQIRFSIVHEIASF
jgi:hypothetical protein